MKKVGEYIVYRKKVCKIESINYKKINDIDYYVLVPMEDQSLKIEIPVTIDKKFIRDLFTKEEIEKTIKKIPKITPIEVDDKAMENEYKKLLDNDNLEDYIKIIKTTYLRNKEREANRRKISDKDQSYHEQAEKYLYNEIAAIFDMNYEEAKEYVIKEVENLKEEN